MRYCSGTMTSRSSETEVVYRGTDTVALLLIEERLRLEGLEPQRLGRADAALLGAGESALQQLIVVPKAHAPAAMALLEQIRAASATPEHDAELTSAALSARPEPPPTTPVDKRVVTAALVVGVLLLIVMMVQNR